MKIVHNDRDLKNGNSCAEWLKTILVLAVGRLGVTNPTHARIPPASSMALVSLLAFTMLIPSAWAAPSYSAPDASGYEIPLGELNKVKKERPLKREKKLYRKKKIESSDQQPSTDVVGPPVKAEQTPATQGVASGVLPTEPLKQTPSEITGAGGSNKTDPPANSTVPVSIHHDPYSYVITGKRTTIQAVISSADSIQAVYCRFRASETGTHALVPMVQVPGTLFTYTATLPSLAASSRSLRYSIVAVDASGNETLSREFAIGVKSSSVLPGWQREHSTEPIKIRIDNKEKPLEGFSDPGIVE